MENNHFQWVNPLCLWPCSIAIFGHNQRVNTSWQRDIPSLQNRKIHIRPERVNHLPLASPSSRYAHHQSGWWLTYPSEKYEFVSWDDEIPNWMASHKTCSKAPTSQNTWKTHSPNNDITTDPKMGKTASVRGVCLGFCTGYLPFGLLPPFAKRCFG